MDDETQHAEKLTLIAEELIERMSLDGHGDARAIRDFLQGIGVCPTCYTSMVLRLCRIHDRKNAGDVLLGSLVGVAIGQATHERFSMN